MELVEISHHTDDIIYLHPEGDTVFYHKTTLTLFPPGDAMDTPVHSPG